MGAVWLPAVMARWLTLGRWVARAAAFAAVGAVAMMSVGWVLGAVTRTCSTVCDPYVSGPMGVVAGLAVAVLLPGTRWQPLEEEPD